MGQTHIKHKTSRCVWTPTAQKLRGRAECLGTQTRRLNQHLAGPTKRGIIVNNKHNRFRGYHNAFQLCTGNVNWTNIHREFAPAVAQERAISATTLRQRWALSSTQSRRQEEVYPSA